MEALTGEDEGEDNDWIKEERDTDSRTCLSAKSSKDDVDKRSDSTLPVTILCSTTTNGTQRKEEPPFFVEEKRFMVYICGGYKGKNQQS